MTCNQIPNFLGRLSIVKQVEVLLADESVLDEPLPIDQALPKVTPNQHDQHMFCLPCLEQCQRLEQLVERAESSRESDQRFGAD